MTKKKDTLAKHPLGLAVTVIVLACFAYALLDLVLFTETYTRSLPWIPFAIAGLAGLGLGLLTVKRLSLAKSERVVLPVLTTAALLFAAWPGLLRINMLTDSQGAFTARYQHVGNGRLEPLDDGLPEIHASRFESYWLNFSADAVHEITLRKGGLDFHQYNWREIQARAIELEQLQQIFGQPRP